MPSWTDQVSGHSLYEDQRGSLLMPSRPPYGNGNDHAHDLCVGLRDCFGPTDRCPLQPPAKLAMARALSRSSKGSTLRRGEQRWQPHAIRLLSVRCWPAACLPASLGRWWATRPPPLLYRRHEKIPRGVQVLKRGASHFGNSGGSVLRREIGARGSEGVCLLGENPSARCAFRTDHTRSRKPSAPTDKAQGGKP